MCQPWILAPSTIRQIEALAVVWMVRARGVEPLTSPMSRERSTTELSPPAGAPPENGAAREWRHIAGIRSGRQARVFARPPIREGPSKRPVLASRHERAGDGADTYGQTSLARSRDEAIAAGITINGHPGGWRPRLALAQPRADPRAEPHRVLSQPRHRRPRRLRDRGGRLRRSRPRPRPQAGSGNRERRIPRAAAGLAATPRAAARLR